MLHYWHAFSYCYLKWDPRAQRHYYSLGDAILQWSALDTPHVVLVCELLDFFYFVVWCHESHCTEQCRLLVPTFSVASDCLARTVPPIELSVLKPRRIGWLAMFANTGNPMTVALRHCAPALIQSGYELIVYAWRFSDQAFLDRMLAIGATCHQITGNTSSERIAGVQQQIAQDGPMLVVTDMNNAVPTALFSSRIAPAQVFMQAGMPAWLVRNLDGVLNSFGFDPKFAQWGDAIILPFHPPWELEALDPPRDDAEIERERATILTDLRLIGCYGRLVKVTQPYLEAVEQILLRCPDVAFAVGGTGDPAKIEAFIAQSPVGHRMHLQARFVPGHSWGRFLHVFLDTWPVYDGEPAREMIAKHRPVVMRRSVEMPAVDAQRDPELIGDDWDEFITRATDLLQHEPAHQAACDQAAALARSMTDSHGFNRQLIDGLEQVIAHCSPPSSEAEHCAV